MGIEKEEEVDVDVDDDDDVTMAILGALEDESIRRRFSSISGHSCC